MFTKSSTSESKKRQCSVGEERVVDNKRRSTDSHAEPDSDKPTYIEEGGLDLSLSFQPISAYFANRKEMLRQCFSVLGENNIRKMLPEELKVCTTEEIKKLCWAQLEQISEKTLMQIFEGRDLTEDEDNKKKDESQQDHAVNTTASVKENCDMEDLKQGSSGEESDILSITADLVDSDIEVHKDDKAVVSTGPTASQPELHWDIDRSVCEILTLDVNAQAVLPQRPDYTEKLETTSHSDQLVPRVVVQPSAQQLELLELEMRARAIKALMNANDCKKQYSF
ncbi:caspase activity and apoptosis inhibitor 1 [Denticeps clupeoides]|uniref:caspase activity and apoptosis inhibitor 1 n=1 Tax=Denticeps clupeoides TaxID=299321 RepID=UPI0010A2EB30|nr:caspase activity and apoptosis inhibitor 1 [Denticeps clupeoides]